MKKTITIVLILLSISFLSCQNNENSSDSWTKKDKEFLLKSCIENSTKEDKVAEKECDCFVNEIVKNTANPEEFDKITIEELAEIKNKCNNKK